MRDVIDRPEILQFLAAHHWVASTAQLRALGVTKAVLQHARRRGTVTSPTHGVVVLAGVALTLEGRALAAQLSARGPAFVSGPTAGALHGLRGMPTRLVELTTKERHHVTLPADARLVRTSWFDEARDVVVRGDGMRLASPLRTLFGLASQFNEHRFERAAEDMWHRRLVAPEQAWEYLAAVRRSGRTGVARLEAWLERTAVRDRPAQSGLELDVLDIIARAGLPTPVCQHPVVLPSGERIHLDVAWPGIRLAVEPGHSWWHGGDLGQRRDQARDRACSAIGWLVVRVDEDVRSDPDGFGRELVAIHRARSVAAQDH